MSKNNKKNIEALYPLSPMQQGMLFHSLYAPESGVYVQQLSVTLKGALDVEAFKQAWRQVVRRHAILRTAFIWEGIDEPLQVVGCEVQLPIDERDWAPLSPGERAAQLDAYLREDLRAGFKLSKAPLMRLALFRCADDLHQFVWTHHHIVLDGWSVPILMREVFAFYEVGRQGTTARLEAVHQYGDYIAWLKRQELSQAEAFWRRTLAGFTVPTRLPGDRAPSGLPGQEIDHLRLHTQVSSNTTAALQNLAREHQLTLNTIVQAAWAILLMQYNDEKDVVFGVTSSGRPVDLPGVEAIVGLFVNTLPLRVKWSAENALLEWLEQLQRHQVEVRQYEYSPLAQVQGWSEAPAGLPLFDSILAFESYPVDDSLAEQRQSLEIGDVRVFEKTNYPITLQVSPRSDLLLRILYDPRRFVAPAITRMLEHLKTLLESMAADPRQRLADLPMMSEAERNQQVVVWNQTARPEFMAGDSCLHHFIQGQAARTPQEVAVVFERTALAYREVNERANRLAHYLRSLGVGPEARVGLMMERSVEMVVSLLAILKAGGAYVPLDPAYPRQRLAFMVEDSQAPILLTQAHLRDSVPAAGNARIVAVDEKWPEIAQYDAGNPESSAGPKNLAYVIYTSGSTGLPKGAMNTHRAICNRLLWMQDAYRLTADDRVLQKTPFSFDVSVWEFFWPLMTGARLVIARPGGHQEPAYLTEIIRDEGVTTLHFVPSMLHLFLEEREVSKCHSIRKVICSGEALPYQLQESFFAKLGAELHNLYGPTEAAVDVTSWACERDSQETLVPIGRPIANIQIYVLNDRMQPVPIGAEGELHIGGVGLARGYHRRPELTAEKFVPNPFGAGPEERLYKTGDRVRYLADGRIEYLGRLDDQVKLRGLRIELGEIEAVIAEHAGVREAVVALREDLSNDKRLVAYVVQDPRYRGVEGEAKAFEERVSEWRMIYDETYGASGSVEDQTFNLAGWNSSYTGQPIPASEMLEWIDHTVAQIKALEPRRILEIGCGAGLLLFRIAHECESYWATDLSESALRLIRQQVAAEGRELPQLVLLRRPADNFADIQSDTFDTVVLNSVIQYFPDSGYLIRVLEGAVNAVRPGGKIFIGDVRSLPLVEALHASVQLHQASDTLSLSRLLDRVRRKVAQEEELLVAPAFFAVLKESLPKIGHVEISLKRGRSHNELTKFRYDVILHVGVSRPSIDQAAAIEWWPGMDLAAVRHEIVETSPDRLLLTGIPNARIWADVNLLKLLAGADASATAGELRERLRTKPSEEAVDPEDVMDLFQGLPYDINITWSGSGKDGRFDLIFNRRKAGPAAEAAVDERWAAGVVADPTQWEHYFNNPLRGAIARKLIPELRRHVGGRLPQFMVPSAFIVLDSLPLSPNGKLDRRALPAPDTSRLDQDQPYVAPRTANEIILAEIWSHALGVEQVGVRDNFFALGGDSIRSIQVLSLAQDKGLRVTLQDLFRHQTIHELAQALETRIETAAEPAQDEAFDLVSSWDRARIPAEVEEAYPLAQLQAGMLFHSELDPDEAVYQDVFSSYLKVAFDHAALEKAIEQICSRHAILRTAFDMINYSEPLQLVYRNARAPMQVEDLREFPFAEQESRLAEWLQEEKRRRFDWSRPPLLRFSVHRRSEETFQFTLSFHHAILDGWSVASMLTELFHLYHSLLPGQAAVSLAPPPQTCFKDFVRLEREALNSAEQREFWEEYLVGSQPTALPRWGDAPRAERAAREVRVHGVPLSEDLCAALIRLAKSLGLPLKNVLLAAHLRVLSLLSGRADVVTGLVSNGRPEESDGDRTLGMFLNTLPTRVQLTGGTWEDLAKRCFDAERELLPFRRFPLPEIQRFHGGPVFETAFSFVHFHVYQAISANKDIEYIEGNFLAETNFSFLVHFNLDITNTLIRFEIDYDSRLLLDEQIKEIGQYYARSLQAMVENPSQPYKTHSLLTSQERLQILRGFNQTRAEYGDGTVIDALDHWAKCAPHRLALVAGEQRWTYRQLSERSDSLARRLRELGVRAEEAVAILLERSAWAICAIFGIMKAGAAYLPLEVKQPPTRWRRLLADSRARALLTSREWAEKLGEVPGLSRLYPEEEEWSRVEALAARPEPEQLAYLIYTSGSAGEPKAVAVEHRQLWNYVCGVRERVDWPLGGRSAVVSTLAADLGHTSVYATLSNGGQLHLIGEEEAMDGVRLAEYLEEEEIECLKIVPSHLKASLESGRRVAPQRKLVFGGERLSWELVERVRELGAGCEIYNHYGPTETTVGALSWEVKGTGGVERTVALGWPLGNVEVYVLDEEGEPAPVGVEGEIYIGGAGVSRGYWVKARLTAEKYVPDGHSGRVGGRLYRTGDVGRYLPDGRVEFVGRRDEQVKLRGHRVELGEIAWALRKHPEVGEAIVVLGAWQGGAEQLVGYLIGRGERRPSARELKEHLRELLPEHMIPGHYVWLAEIPLTPNGKLDRRALPEPDGTLIEIDRIYIAPRNATEEVIAEIWTQFLGRERISVDDNFFDLGGHSLLATQVVGRLRLAFRAELPLRNLFESPTVEKIADVIRQLWGDSEIVEEIARTAKEVAQLSSDEVEQLLYLEKISGVSHPSNGKLRQSPAFQ